MLLVDFYVIILYIYCICLFEEYFSLFYYKYFIYFLKIYYINISILCKCFDKNGLYLEILVM